MKPPTRHRLHVITALVLTCLPLMCHALTVDNGTVTAQIEELDTFQAEQERLKAEIADKPPAYVDKVMDDSPLTFENTNAATTEEPEGLRSYYLDNRTYLRESTSQSGYKNQHYSYALRGEYRQQTLNYGELVAQLEIQTQKLIESWTNKTTEQVQQKLTLTSYDLPLTETITSDNYVGDFNGGITEALSRQARFSLGNSTVRGVGTKLKHKKFEIRAGFGKRGVWDSTPTPSFNVSTGTSSWLGYSHKLNDNWQTGIQYNKSTDINNADTKLTVHSMAATLNYQHQPKEARTTQARLTLLKSQHTDGTTNNSSQGFFSEGAFYQGHYYHEWGLFFSEPNLYFGNNLIADNNKGAYWRTSYQSNQINWGVGIDTEKTNHLQTSTHTTGVNLNLQKRLDLNSTLSTQFNYHFNSANQDSTSNRTNAINATISYERKLANKGTSRIYLNIHRQEQIVANSNNATGEELSWEQTWTDSQTIEQTAITTTLGIAQDRSTTRTLYPTAGINMRGWLNKDWSINSNLRYSARRGNLSTSQGLAGTVAVERRIDSHWQLGASASLNQAKIETTSTLLNTASIYRTRDKSVNFYLRWDGNYGKPFTTQGTAQNKMGYGSIKGLIFADLNRDGKQQADETGIANIEVLLDGRHAARTDNNGYFSFYATPTGQHQLSINLDTVPLPWGSPNDKNELDLNVPLRGYLTPIIPLVKIQG